jgi:hypothetical protein
VLTLDGYAVTLVGASPASPLREISLMGPSHIARLERGRSQATIRLGVSPATLYRYIPTARTANTLRD